MRHWIDDYAVPLVLWVNSHNVPIIEIIFSTPANHVKGEISVEIENHTDDDYDDINEDDNDDEDGDDDIYHQILFKGETSVACWDWDPLCWWLGWY